MTEFDRPKHRIAQTFGRAASTYHEQAHLQRECAADLLQLLAPRRDRLPPGPVLELGCGTGFVTEHLLRTFPDRALEITDLSPAMVAFCRDRFSEESIHQPVTYKVWDGEAEPQPDDTYALIVAGFVIQWFSHPAAGLKHLLGALKPGGMVLVSFPESSSFPEWRQVCEQCHVPFTANPLPELDGLLKQLDLSPQDYYLHRRKIAATFTDTASFFKQLKAIGTGYNTAQKALSPHQMKQLIHYWNRQSPGQITVHYHIAFLLLFRR